MPNVRFTILTIFKCTVQAFGAFTFLSNHCHHRSLELFSSYEPEILFLLSNNGTILIRAH